MAAGKPYLKPNLIDRLFNRAFGCLAGLGLGHAHNYRLTVRGRKSGRAYRTPVNVLNMDGCDYLVAPRGETGWVRNVRASGDLRLTRGSDDARYAARELPESERIPVLREYLRRYHKTVQRYFAVDPASADADYARSADRHPVFALERLDPRPQASPPRS